MENLLFYILGIFLILIVGKILLLPMKIILELIANGIAGGITLLLFNFVGKFFGLLIEITPLNAILSGFFGLPGVILILLIEKLG